jgi:hypothetical protein
MPFSGLEHLVIRKPTTPCRTRSGGLDVAMLSARLSAVTMPLQVGGAGPAGKGPGQKHVAREVAALAAASALNCR